MFLPTHRSGRVIHLEYMICFILYTSIHNSYHLTHWGRVTHICVSKLAIIVPDNGLSPDRRQAIIWTNGGILLIRTSGTNFSEIVSEIHIFSFTKMHLKMSSAKWQPFCLGLNVLKVLELCWALSIDGRRWYIDWSHHFLTREHIAKWFTS